MRESPRSAFNGIAASTTRVLSCLLALTILFSHSTSVSAQRCPDFPGVRSIMTEKDPWGQWAITHADFNSDGTIDVALANFFDTVTVLLGHGDGSFVESTTIYVGGSQNRSIVTGDFNADGKVDIAVQAHYARWLTLLYGKGDGTFQPPTELPTISDAEFVTAGDISRDGRPDLVTANGSNLGIHLMQPDGAFAPVVTHAIGSSSAVAIGDVNNDQKADLVTTAYGPGTLRVHIGDGTGAFAPAAKYDSAPGPWFVGIADLVGDGNADLVVVSFDQSNDVWIHAGNGTGTFGEAKQYRIGRGIYSLAFADFNQDGRTDIATSNNGSRTLAVLASDGKGGMLPARSYDVPIPAVLTAFEADGDGRVDLVFTGGGGIYLGRGNGDGTIDANDSYLVGPQARGLAVGDFDRDGALDIAAASRVHGDISIFRGDGNGRFEEPTQYYRTGVATVFITVGDFDGDGWLDLAATNGVDEATDRVSILMNDKKGGLVPTREYATGEAPTGIAAADLNADGKLDLAVTNRLSNDLALLYGAGDGTFALELQRPGLLGPISVSAVDFDRDNVPELVVPEFDGWWVDVLRRVEGGKYQQGSVCNSQDNPYLSATADFDEDGELDLVVSAVMGVNWHRGAGYNSYFVPGAQYHGGVASPGGIVAGDFNGDGHADFIVANTASHSMSVFTGDGDGNFAFRGDQYASEMALVMVAADFNKDGLLDLAYTQYDPGRVTVAINKGPCAKPRRGRPVSRP